MPGKICDAIKTQLTFTGFENGKVPGAKKFRPPLEAGRSKRLLEPLEEANLADILNSAQVSTKMNF